VTGHFLYRRREVITLLGGAAAAWPLAATAQQGGGMRRIGFITGQAAEDSEAQTRLAAFQQELQTLGWAVGRNTRMEYRWGGGSADRIRGYVRELVEFAPDVILASGAATMGFVLQATRTIPVVFVNLAAPVGAGYVDSLSRPGGNATGFVQFEYGLSAKWLELLKEIAPGVKRAAIIRDPAVSSGLGQWGAIQSAAPAVGLEVSPVNVRDTAEIERALGAFARSPNGGMIVTGSALAACIAICWPRLRPGTSCPQSSTGEPKAA